MTFEEYQRLAARTACYDAQVWNTYLVPALIGEVGELVEVFAKHVRDCDPGGTYGAVLCPDCRPKVRAETGDCLWMVSQIARHMEFSFGWPGWEPGRNVYRATFRRLMRASAMLENWHDPHPHVGFMNLIEVLEGLGAIAKMCGTTLEQIGAANNEKLASRAERGVIGGDGDGR